MESARITKLDFKLEGETPEGLPMGLLTDQNANPYYPDGRWVTKRDALKIAEKLGIELFEY